MEIIGIIRLLGRFLVTLTFLSFSFFFISSAYGDLEADPALPEPSQFWHTLENYNWIFQTTMGVEEISITNNGKVINNGTYTIKKYKDFIHAIIPLTLEKENHLIFHANGMAIFSIDLFYAKSFHAETVPDDYEPYFFHISQNESLCVGCHQLESNKDDILPISPSANICYPCHHADFPKSSDKVVKRQKYVPQTSITEKTTDSSIMRLDLMVLARASKHTFAITNWECLTCHQSTPAESDFLPDTLIKFMVNEEEGVAPLCYTCHLERQEKNASYSFVHGPIGMGGCNMCHNPHFSNEDKLLEDKPNALCLDCHDMEESLALPHIHPPVLQEGCIVCHDPHGSNNAYELVAEISTLCGSCHKNVAKQKNNHPVSGHPVSGFKDPRDEDLQLSCVSCHDPHSSEYENLLSKEEPMMLCIQCHNMAN